MGMDEGVARVVSGEAATVGAAAAPSPRRTFWDSIEDQFALRQLISEYMIPVETNTIWYTLGGVLAMALGLEILTGILLSLVYAPDAGRAYQITSGLIQTPG